MGGGVIYIKSEIYDTSSLQHSTTPTLQQQAMAKMSDLKKTQFITVQSIIRLYGCFVFVLKLFFQLK